MATKLSRGRLTRMDLCTDVQSVSEALRDLATERGDLHTTVCVMDFTTRLLRNCAPCSSTTPEAKALRSFYLNIASLLESFSGINEARRIDLAEKLSIALAGIK